MAKLPDQRGFYDDVRPFQRQDIKVPHEVRVPSRAEQLRSQLLVGGLIFLFLVGALVLRLAAARDEAHGVYKPDSVWKGVNAPPARELPGSPRHSN